MAPARGGRRTPQHAARRNTPHAAAGYLGAALQPHACTLHPTPASARPSLPPPAAHERNQCQVITGFLGAGKTTLVNYVLNEVRQ